MNHTKHKQQTDRNTRAIRKNQQQQVDRKVVEQLKLQHCCFLSFLSLSFSLIYSSCTKLQLKYIEIVLDWLVSQENRNDRDATIKTKQEKKYKAKIMHLFVTVCAVLQIAFCFLLLLSLHSLVFCRVCFCRMCYCLNLSFLQFFLFLLIVVNLLFCFSSWYNFFVVNRSCCWSIK